MENIDDFMRQKFDADDPQERFEFQEEYWEQAQALLEQEEARRRRRLWLIFGLVLAMALLSWFLLLPWGAGALSKNKATEEHSTILTENTENQVYTNSKLTTGEQIIQPSDSIEGPVDGNFQRDGNGSATPVPEKPSQGTQQNRRDNKGMVKPSNSENTWGPAALTSKQIAEGRNPKSPSAQSARLDQSGKKEIENTSSAIATPPVTTPPITTPPITTPPITTPALIPLFNIPAPLILFPIPERALVPFKTWISAKAPIVEKTKPVQDQRFAIGLSLAGAAYQSSDTTGRWAGWAIGLYGKYRLNKNWSLLLGVQERFVPGFEAPEDSSNPNQIAQLRYSFGYKREEWKRATRGQHYLEVPLSAQWHKGSWGLEAGGTAGMLLVVQSRTTYTVETSLEAAKTTVKKFTKGDTAPYNRTYFTAFAGAEYRLNDRISVLARGHYRFTPVLKSLGEDVITKGLGYLEVGLRTRLF